MAEKRAIFSLRRRLALGFSKRRLSRTALRVPSRSIFFFNRRNARSTGSPFFNLISVKTIHFLSKNPGERPSWLSALLGQGRKEYFCAKKSQSAKRDFLSKPLAFRHRFSFVLGMELPGHAVTLTVEQVAELNKQLSNFRHDINNNLALIAAGLEVMQTKPHMAERMLAAVKEQPPKIVESIAKFAAEFDKALGIKR